MNNSEDNKCNNQRKLKEKMNNAKGFDFSPYTCEYFSSLYIKLTNSHGKHNLFYCYSKTLVFDTFVDYIEKMNQHYSVIKIKGVPFVFNNLYMTLIQASMKIDDVYSFTRDYAVVTTGDSKRFMCYYDGQVSPKSLSWNLVLAIGEKSGEISFTDLSIPLSYAIIYSRGYLKVYDLKKMQLLSMKEGKSFLFRISKYVSPNNKYIYINGRIYNMKTGEITEKLNYSVHSLNNDYAVISEFSN